MVTSASVVGDLLRTQGGRLDVLTLARKVRSVGIVVDHVSRAAAAGGVHFLFDGGRDEVLGGRCALLAGNVAWRDEWKCDLSSEEALTCASTAI